MLFVVATDDAIKVLMKESVDTLKLWLQDYEISPGANLTVQPGLVNLQTGEQREKSLYKSDEMSVVGAKAFLNTSKFNLTLANEGTFLQFSAPKVRHKSNGLKIGSKELEEAVGMVEMELYDNGIKTNLDNAKVSRLDIFRQETTNELFPEYSQVFSLLDGQRQNKRSYGTTFLFHNTRREVCFYDKGVEEQLTRGSRQIPPTKLMRTEARLLRKQLVNNSGIQTAKDLVKGYDAISGMYGKEIKGIFRYGIGEENKLYLGSTEIERELCELRNLNGKLTFEEIRLFFIRRGVEGLVPLIDWNDFLEVCQRMTTVQRTRDLKYKLNKLKKTLLGSGAVSGKIKDLYDELYLKFVA